jgi:hypothetical protein
LRLCAHLAVLSLAGCCLDAAGTSSNTLAPSSSGVTGAGSGSGGSSSSSSGGTGTAGGAGPTCVVSPEGKTDCSAIGPPPQDAGPLFAFEPNPLCVPDGGVTAISLAQYPVGGVYIFVQLAQDGGLLGSSPGIVLSDGGNSFTVGGGFGLPPTSWSSDREGHVLFAQSLLNADGSQACTALDEPCGAHGACCVGFSCQATDGGCACRYAWPAVDAGGS